MKTGYSLLKPIMRLSKPLVLAILFIISNQLVEAQVPTANLKLHLKADSGTSTTQEGGQVTSWADASGNGNGPVEMTGPITFEKFIAYGKPAIRLVGNHTIKLPTASQLGIANSNYEIFIVAGVTNSTTNYILGGSETGNFDFTIITTSHAEFFSGNNVLRNYADYYKNGLHILNGAVTDTSMTFSVDGGTPQVNGGSNKSYPTGNLRLGRRGDGSYNMEGYIAEVIIYNRSLSIEEKEQVQTYLNEKYGFGQTPLPGVTVTGAANITGTAATLNGTVTTHGTPENYLETSYRFAYGINPNNLTDTTAVAFAGDGNTSSSYNVSKNISGLSVGTYYYRLLATENGNTNRSGLNSFTTNNVPSDQMSFWLRADYGIGYAFGGTQYLSSWTESSSNQLVFSTSGASFLEYLSDGTNKKPGVKYSGNSYYFKDINTLGLYDTDYEMFFVLNSSTSSAQYLFSDNNGGSSTRLILNDGSGISFMKDGVTLMSYGETGSLTNGKGVIINLKMTGSGGKIYINGSEVASTESNGRFYGNNLYLFYNTATSLQRFNGVLSEFITYKKNLTDQERDDVELYLMKKYNFLTPAVQASNLVIGNVTTSSIDLSVTAGDGIKRMFVAKTGSPITFVPQDNTTYQYGQEFGDSSYVFEIGTAVSTVKYNPGINKTLYFKVFEFNGTAGNEKYNSANPASASVTTPFEKPYVSFNEIQQVDLHSLKLLFEIDAYGDSTYYRIAYGTNSENPTDTTAVDTTYNAENEEYGQIQMTIGNLVQGNYYYFKIIAENRGGISTSSSSLKLDNRPDGYVDKISKLKGDSVLVTAFVDPKGYQTDAKLVYGSHPDSMTVSTATTQIASDAGQTELTVSLHGIIHGKTYFVSVSATNEAGTKISSDFEFTADSAIPNAVLINHLAADYGIEASDGDQVTIWTSILGTENSGAGSLDQEYAPFYATNAINNKPSVYFNGSKYLLTYAPQEISGNDYSMFFVVKSDTSSMQTIFFSEAGYVLFNFEAGLVYYTGGSNLSAGEIGEFNDGKQHLIQINIAESGSTLFVDGELRDSNENDLRYMNSFENFAYIGASEGGFLNGYISELMIWSGNMKQSLSDSISLYLSNKYAIPIPATPVELSSLEATGGSLFWSTATETNNSGWDIEITPVNGETKGGWKKIGFVSGKGTTTEKQFYTFSLSNLKTSSLIRLKQIDLDGKFSYSPVIEFTVNEIPTEFSMAQNYPNPFNPSTLISYQLSTNSHTKLVVYDLLGREIRTLVNEAKPAGKYTVNFSAADLPSGVYFYKLTAGDFSSTKKMMLVK